MGTRFSPGDWVVYGRPYKVEVGVIKRITVSGHGEAAFVYFGEGDTAAHVPFRLLQRIEDPKEIVEPIRNNHALEALRKKREEIYNV